MVCGHKHRGTRTIPLREVAVGLEYSATNLHLLWKQITASDIGHVLELGSP